MEQKKSNVDPEILRQVREREKQERKRLWITTAIATVIVMAIFAIIFVVLMFATNWLVTSEMESAEGARLETQRIEREWEM